MNWGFLIEGVFVGGCVLAWGFWELYALRRDARKAKAEEEAKTAKLAAGDTGHAKG
jgi:hypothetical protein